MEEIFQESPKCGGESGCIPLSAWFLPITNVNRKDKNLQRKEQNKVFRNKKQLFQL